MAFNRTRAFAAFAAAIALSTPALAERTPVRADYIRDQINELSARVSRADIRDTVSEREARDLRGRISSLRDQFHAYNANGLDTAETRRLQARIDNIRSRLRMEKLDWDRHRG